MSLVLVDSMQNSVREWQTLVIHSLAVMRVGSRSFFFAARFLGEELRQAVLFLYCWCRYCDDVVDQVDGIDEQHLMRQCLALDELRRKTWQAMRPTAQLTARSEESVFRAMTLLCDKYQIPAVYGQELLNGMEMDLAGTRYDTLEELELYCYRVAGVVGLMFCHLAGVKDPRALKHAADLGIAMQLTNIARDVLTDAHLGRVYLPRQWLRESGLEANPATILLSENKPALAVVTRRILAAADGYYASGDAGLRYLPWRAALAVAAARYVYAGIGTIVRRRGARAWDRRVVTTGFHKILLLGRAILTVMRVQVKGVSWQ